MAATMIAALNKTTHVSFLRILEPSVFSFSIWFMWHRRMVTHGHDQTPWRAPPKGEARISQRLPYLPLNALFRRSLDTVRGLQSGLRIREYCGADQKSATGERDGRTRPRHTAIHKTLRRPAGFVEGNRGVPQ